MRNTAQAREIAMGVIAGCAAAAATTLFLDLWREARLPPAEHRPLETPPTEKLADALCMAATGKPLPMERRAVAGLLIHYLMGASLGAVYALAVRGRPEVKACHGLAYGLTVWAIVEELGLAALGLKAPPWRLRRAEHLFGACSHAVFGAVLDGAVRALELGFRREGSAQ